MDSGEQRIYPVTITSSSTEQQIPAVAITNDSEKTAFYNELIRGGIEGQKVTSEGKPLPGAVIGLFPADTGSFSTQTEHLPQERW